MTPDTTTKQPPKRAQREARHYVEQPGEGRKTTQPGERDPQSPQTGDLPSGPGGQGLM